MSAVVAVDARRNTWAPQYGISRYTRSLVRALRASADDTLDVRPIDLMGSSTWTGEQPIAVSPAGHSMGARMLQEQRAMRRLPGVDLLHLPWYEGPIRSTVPLVVNVHDLDTVVNADGYRWRFRVYYNTLLRTYIRTARAIIVPSEATASAVRDRWPNRTVVVVPYGVDAHFMPAAPEESRRPGTILYTGGYGPRKRIADLIDAFDRIAASDGDLRLVMAGTPSPEAHALIAGSRHATRIEVTGYLTETELAARYRTATVVAYPSLLEGFGFPVLEAFASGTPVVTTRSGSIPEIAGGAAALVEVGDVRALAEALTDVLASGSHARSLAEAGLRRAQDFRWSEVALRTQAAYRAALAE